MSSKKGKLRATKMRDGRYWVYKSYTKFATELSLSRDQVRGAVRSLVARGLVVSDRNGANGELPYYRLNPDAITNALKAADDVPVPRSRKPAVPPVLVRDLKPGRRS